MKFYRVQRTHAAGTSAGFQYFTAERDAKTHAREWKAAAGQDAKVEPIDIEPTRTGILKALQQFASHPDNG